MMNELVADGAIMMKTTEEISIKSSNHRTEQLALNLKGLVET